MTVYGEKYFSYRSDINRSLLQGRKPFDHGFLVRYIRRLRPNGKLLDLGCGRGFFLEYAQKYYDTFGVDISKYAIARANEKLPNSGLYVGSALFVAYATAQFDVVVCLDLMEHIAKPEMVINELQRVLKVGGFLVISVPNTKSIGKRWKGKDWFGYRDHTHVSLLDRTQWVNLFLSSGFTLVDLFWDGLWDSPYFSGFPTVVQHFFFKIPSTLLFYLEFPFPESFGENLLIILKKN